MKLLDLILLRPPRTFRSVVAELVSGLRDGSVQLENRAVLPPLSELLTFSDESVTLRVVEGYSTRFVKPNTPIDWGLPAGGLTLVSLRGAEMNTKAPVR